MISRPEFENVIRTEPKDEFIPVSEQSPTKNHKLVLKHFFSQKVLWSIIKERGILTKEVVFNMSQIFSDDL